MKKLLMAFAILCSVSAMSAEPDYYAALCAWAPGQLPSSSSSVIWGIRGTLFYGDHLRMEGLDLAIGANRTRERFDGLGIAFVYNYANSLAGMELGFANVVERESYGVQFGAWNHAGEGYGEQRGIVNTAGYCAGLQNGFFNWSDDLAGVGLQDPGHDLEERALPFAVAAGDARSVARLDVEADVLEHGRPAEGDRHVAEGQQRHGRGV